MDTYIKEIESNLSCPAELGRIMFRMITEGAISEHMAGLLKNILDRRAKHLRETSTTEMVLHTHPEFVLQVRRIGGGLDFVQRSSGSDSYIHTPGRLCMVVVPENADIGVESYRLSPDRMILQRQGVRSRLSSPIFENFADGLVHRYTCTTGSSWMLRLGFGQYAEETRFYDRDTLKFVFSSAVRGELSSLVTLCRVFGATRDEGYPSGGWRLAGEVNERSYACSYERA